MLQDVNLNYLAIQNSLKYKIKLFGDSERKVLWPKNWVFSHLNGKFVISHLKLFLE